RRSTDSDTGDGAASGNVEHHYLAVGERHEAELPVTGNGDRWWGTVQANDSRRFWRYDVDGRRDRCENIEQVVLLIWHKDFAGDGVVIHRAKLPPAEQCAGNLPRIQINGDDGALTSRNIRGKTAGDADILRPSVNWHRAKQVSVRFIDRD